MICMGAGTNHWFHSDETYRSFIALLLLSGCVGINGGGWAHYVGQEKIRTFAGWQQLAFGLDWRRPGRQAQGTTFYYTHTEQWRYDRLRPEQFASPLGEGALRGDDGDRRARQGRADGLDAVVSAVGPQPARARRRGDGEGRRPGRARRRPSSRRGGCGTPSRTRATRSTSRACSSSGARTCSAPRARGRSTSCAICSARRHDGPLAEPLPEGERPTEVQWRDEIPNGKLDLLVNVDFRMTTTGLYSDVVLPAATWYEKHDLSMTDMHPFIHSFNQAVPPPWEARSDWDCFGAIARAFSALAAEHLGVRRDIVSGPVQHDTPGEISPAAAARSATGAAGECEPIPGRTMPVADRGRARLRRGRRAVGRARAARRAARLDGQERVVEARPRGRAAQAARNGIVRGGVADGRPSLERPQQVAETILALSGVSNGRLAVDGLQVARGALRRAAGRPGRASPRRRGSPSTTRRSSRGA